MTPQPHPVRSLFLQALLGLEWGFAAIMGVKRLIGTLTPSHSTTSAIAIGSGLAAVAVAAVAWHRRSDITATSSDAPPNADVDRLSRGRRFLTAFRSSIESWCLCILPGMLVSLCLARHSPWAAALGVFLMGTSVDLLTRIRRRDVVSMETMRCDVPVAIREEAKPLGIVSESIEARQEIEDDEVLESEAEFDEATLDDDEAEESGVCQRIVRRQSESGDSIEAVYTVVFAAGSSHAALHMTFQPPFDRPPHVNAMVVDSEESVRLSPAVVYRYGARVDLRRVASMHETSVMLSVEVATAIQGVKAA
jgi:hypothetical protein